MGFEQVCSFLMDQQGFHPVSHVLAVQEPRACVTTVNQVCIQNHRAVSVASVEGDLTDHQSALTCPFASVASGNCPDLHTGNLPLFNSLLFLILCESGSIRKPFTLTVANLHAKCSHSQRLSNTDDILSGCGFSASVGTDHLSSLGIRQRHPFVCLISSTY